MRLLIKPHKCQIFQLNWQLNPVDVQIGTTNVFIKAATHKYIYTMENCYVTKKYT